MNPIAVHACNPGPMTGDGNWTWLIRGRVPTLIDAGTGDPRHLDAVEHALDGQTLRQVLVTHGHSDHASGAPAVAARFPDAVFLKKPWDRDRRWSVDWHAIHDGAVLEVGDDRLVAVPTPGHALDHLAFWHEPTRTLISGDLALAHTTVYIPANSGGDLSEYLASLERVLALEPRRLLPAHGPVIEEPARLLAKLISHRRRRETQIVELLRAHTRTAQAIASAIYEAIEPAFMPLAIESVTAHLVKLERDGRARRGDDGSWLIIDP